MEHAAFSVSWVRYLDYPYNFLHIHNGVLSSGTLNQNQQANKQQNH